METIENQMKPHALHGFIKNMANYILVLWCLLPVAMSICDMVLGLLGKLPSEEYLAENGFTLGESYYTVTLDIYRSAFHVLGVVTIIIAILLLILSASEWAKKKAMRAAPWFYLLGALLIWSFICTLLSENFSNAFWGEFYLNDGFASYCIYASIFICAASIKKESIRRLILRVFGSVVCYLAILMVLQKMKVHFFVWVFPGHEAVVFNQFNHFGYILCMGILVMFGLFVYDRPKRKLTRWLYLLGFAFLTYALLLNDTFGSYIAALAALPIMYIFYFASGRRPESKEKWIEIFLPAAVFAVLSVLDVVSCLPLINALSENFSQLAQDTYNTAMNTEAADSAGTGRLVLWKDTIQRISERPIFGFGPTGFVGENAITGGNVPHNEYLQVAGYMGIPGILLYLAAIITLLVHHCKNLKKLNPFVLAVGGATVAYLISACFGNPVFNTVPYFWMFFGLTTATSEREGTLFSVNVKAEKRLRTSSFSFKKIIVFVVIGLAVLAAIIIGSKILTTDSEKELEINDLQNMQCADLTAQYFLKNSDLNEKTAYWYDSTGFTLIKLDESKPAAYGSGTKTSGGGLDAFTKDQGVTYDYDESSDYTGKIIEVTIDPDSSEITLEWVD